MGGPVGVILGTGAEAAITEWEARATTVHTAYGEVVLYSAEIGQANLLLLPRHGLHHTHLPHRLPYKAHLLALRQCGVRFVLATNACGALNCDMPPGSLAIPHDLIDLSRRPSTFWDDVEVTDAAHAHNDFTEPYCHALRTGLLAAAEAQQATVAPRAVYVSVDGPRFETAAEVRLYASWGGDLVGMTGGPEAILAREAGLCYASIAIIGNLAAGLNTGPILHEAVTRACAAATERAIALILQAAATVKPTDCRCPAVVAPPPPSV